jgi:hypothetical protein
MDARRSIPRVNAPIEIMDGNYYLVKTDIFKQLMYFSTDPNGASSTAVPVDRVRELIALNKKGIKPDLLIDENHTTPPVITEPNFSNAVDEESITRFDNTNKRKNKRKNNNRSDRNKQAKKGNENNLSTKAEKAPGQDKVTSKPEQTKQIEQLSASPEKIIQNTPDRAKTSSENEDNGGHYRRNKYRRPNRQFKNKENKNENK